MIKRIVAARCSMRMEQMRWCSFPLPQYARVRYWPNRRSITSSLYDEQHRQEFAAESGMVFLSCLFIIGVGTMVTTRMEAQSKKQIEAIQAESQRKVEAIQKKTELIQAESQRKVEAIQKKTELIQAKSQDPIRAVVQTTVKRIHAEAQAFEDRMNAKFFQEEGEFDSRESVDHCIGEYEAFQARIHRILAQGRAEMERIRAAESPAQPQPTTTVDGHLPAEPQPTTVDRIQSQKKVDRIQAETQATMNRIKAESDRIKAKYQKEVDRIKSVRNLSESDRIEAVSQALVDRIYAEAQAVDDRMKAKCKDDSLDSREIVDYFIGEYEALKARNRRIKAEGLATMDHIRAESRAKRNIVRINDKSRQKEADRIKAETQTTKNRIKAESDRIKAQYQKEVDRIISDRSLTVADRYEAVNQAMVDRFNAERQAMDDRLKAKWRDDDLDFQEIWDYFLGEYGASIARNRRIGAEGVATIHRIRAESLAKRSLARAADMVPSSKASPPSSIGRGG